MWCCNKIDAPIIASLMSSSVRAFLTSSLGSRYFCGDIILSASCPPLETSNCEICEAYLVEYAYQVTISALSMPRLYRMLVLCFAGVASHYYRIGQAAASQRGNVIDAIRHFHRSTVAKNMGDVDRSAGVVDLASRRRVNMKGTAGSTLDALLVHAIGMSQVAKTQIWALLRVQ